MRADQHTILEQLYLIIPIGKPIKMEDIMAELNLRLERLDMSPIKSRNTVGEKIKRLKEMGAPIMFGWESEDVQQTKKNGIHIRQP